MQETEIHHVVLTMKDGPAIANQARLRMHEHFQGPMGFGTPDDSEAWERVQRGGGAGNDLWIMLNRGLPGETRTADGLRSDVSAETGMRAPTRHAIASPAAPVWGWRLSRRRFSSIAAGSKPMTAR